MQAAATEGKAGFMNPEQAKKQIEELLALLEPGIAQQQLQTQQLAASIAISLRRIANALDHRASIPNLKKR
jgi:hypothetical protein